SRFVIAPSDPDQAHANVLQCGLLGAFGGFFECSFRVHDFLLGRRNCQKFLKSHFALPTTNPVLAMGLQRAGTRAPSIEKLWGADAPTSELQSQGKTWIPLIPLCGTAAVEVQRPPRGLISQKSLSEIVDLISKRLKRLGPLILEDAPAGWVLRTVLDLALSWPIVAFLKRKVRDALSNALRPNISGE